MPQEERKDPEGAKEPTYGPQTKEEKELDDFQKRIHRYNPEGVPDC